MARQKKPKELLWVRSCYTSEKYGGFHIAFPNKKKALRDCVQGKKQGCAGARGDCPGLIPYIPREKVT